MKSRLFASMFLITVLMFSVPAFAAESLITINPIGFAAGLIGGEYEQATGKDMSVAVQGLYYGTTVNGVRVTMLGGGAGLRKYMSGRALHGFYVGADGTMARLSVTDGVQSGQITMFGVNGTAGFKWISGNGFVFDLGATVGTVLSVSGSASTGESFSGSGVSQLGTGLKLAIGYAW